MITTNEKNEFQVMALHQKLKRIGIPLAMRIQVIDNSPYRGLPFDKEFAIMREKSGLQSIGMLPCQRLEADMREEEKYGN